MEQDALIQRIAQHAPTEGFHDTAIPGLRLYRQNHATTEPLPTIYDPSICVIVQGVKCLRFGAETITYDAGHYLVNALTLPLAATIPEAAPAMPFLGFLIRFDPVQVGKLLAEIDDLIAWPSDMSVRAIDACPITPGLAQATHRLIGCLVDPVDRKVLAEGLVREVLYDVLRGPRGIILRAQTLRGSSSQRVGRAVAFLEQHYREPLTIEAIADQASMSPSALHQHFKQVTALSPMQFVQRLRLHQAHALLLGGRGAAEAGFAVGYNSPSQFSREFRRLFGMSPSRVRQSGEGMALTA
ncbi:MAG: AraC family transcriptional regulator [Acidobacteriota bacterium]